MSPMTTADFDTPCFILTALAPEAEEMLVTLGPGSPAPGMSLVLRRQARLAAPGAPWPDLYQADDQPDKSRALDFASALTWMMAAGDIAVHPISSVPRVTLPPTERA